MTKSIDVDTKTFIRFWLVVAAFIIMGLLIIKAKTGLIIIGMALFFSIALSPLMKLVDKIDKKKKRPVLAAILTVSVVVVAIGFVIATVGPVVISETSRFLSQAPSQMSSALGDMSFIDEIGDSLGIDDAKAQIVTFIKNTSSSILGSIPQTLFESFGAVANFFTGFVLMIVLTILFMIEGPSIFQAFIRKIDSKSINASKLSQRISVKISGVISKYVTGQILVAVLDGVVAGLAVFILSLLFGFSSGLAFPMALTALVFYLIPMFGPIISCSIISLVLFFSNPWAALAYLIFYIIYAQIAANVIAPKIQGNSMDLPPLVILIAITLGMYMFGLVGAIISIPIAGIIKVLVDEYPNFKKLSEAI